MVVIPRSDVLVTVRFFDEDAVARLEARGHRVVRADIPVDGIDNTITSAVEEALSGVSAWIIGAAPVTGELLARYPNLLIVARRGVGFDTVDVEAIQAQGRILTNTPGGNEPAVADHAIGLMLAVGKQVVQAHARMRSGDWRVQVGSELYRKTVGLVGLGRIGRHVAQRLTGFETRILAFDPYLDDYTAQQLGVTRCSLEDLLTQSDYISLHAPLTEQTRHIISAGSISLMKPEAVLVNTSRGELVDERALLNALRERRIAGAGLDVFGCEYEPSLKEVADQLLEMPTVVCTPHSAASSRESLRRANEAAADCVAAALEGVPIPPNCIVADGRTSRID
jgi:D-3-phosphoglycerate dehydrogenase / 2-oxoglutarate reductase